ncbi:uncharacterized protein TNCV_4094761 [Trichonephila clavipes]|uniref:Uncharacterized protein n=1 Tax=Trichonephila clavipes TaxID=2585209 RepID=A0A8X6S8G1_TRICX|nr:uncharacterized protein TNCV_4094761 [Trichonephila clavipes]
MTQIHRFLKVRHPTQTMKHCINLRQVFEECVELKPGRPGFDARCHQIPSECTRSTCSLNQWVRSLVGLFTSARTGEYFPPLQFTCRNCGGGDRDRVAIYRPFEEVSLSLNRTVTCMVLKANDRRTSCPCHDEFHGPRSDYVRQVALATTTTTTFIYFFFSFLLR